MAIVRTPILSFKASGTLSRSVTYGNWKTLNTVREYVVPTDPNTPAQQEQRTALADAVAFARTIWSLPGIKAAWNRQADRSGKRITGWNLFLTFLME